MAPKSLPKGCFKAEDTEELFRCQNKYSKSLSWAENLNKLFTEPFREGKFKSSANRMLIWNIYSGLKPPLAAASFGAKIQIINKGTWEKKMVSNDFNEIHSFSIKNYQLLYFSKIKISFYYIKKFQASFVKFEAPKKNLVWTNYQIPKWVRFSQFSKL